jgi:hypothetical protein
MEALISGAFLLVLVWLVVRETQQKEHIHRGASWDGFRESCACGANAGDKRDPKTDVRYSFFSEWPEE